ncbi:hypothetical protein PRIC1_013833 [Phytophthora ramorum]
MLREQKYLQEMRINRKMPSPWLWTLLLSLLVYTTSRPLDRLPGGDSDNSVHFVQLANAVNAVMAAGASACVTHTVHLLTSRNSSVEAIAAGLNFALSKLTWEYATGLEVFGLNNYSWGRYMFWCFVDASISRGGTSLDGSSFYIGLSIYLQTFVSAQEPTPGSWGDTSTLGGLFDHVRRKEYGTFRLSPLSGESEGLLLRLEAYGTDCFDDFHWMGLVLMCFGAKILLFPGRTSSNITQHHQSSWYRHAGYAQMSAMISIGTRYATFRLAKTSGLT